MTLETPRTYREASQMAQVDDDRATLRGEIPTPRDGVLVAHQANAGAAAPYDMSTDCDTAIQTVLADMSPAWSEGTEAAAARTVAHNARDRDDLLDLLNHLGLPAGEDNIAELLPLLNDSTNHHNAGAHMPHPTSTVNAYLAVAVSMLNDGTDADTVRQTLDLSEDEIHNALRQAARPSANAPTTDDLEELLAWAEQHDSSSCQSAVEIRASLTNLARRRENTLIVEQVQAKVTALESDLARAREELRDAMNTASMPLTTPALAVAPASDPRTKEETAPAVDRGTIRRWAKAQGLSVADRGALPKDVISAYHAVHNDTAFHEAG